MDPFYAAVAHSVEEAVLNALVVNDGMVGRDGHRSPRLPTYHFAHAVDDHLMRVTTVIRGDEWFSSIPLHLQLFGALGGRVWATSLGAGRGATLHVMIPLAVRDDFTMTRAA